MIKRLENEAGYSLVEVIVSILLLSIAIIPMVAMFDMGLKTATRGSTYDKARAVANGSMENIKATPYNRSGTAALDSVVERYAPGADHACPVSVPTGFTCAIRTRYANPTFTSFQDSPQTPQMEVVVRVGWQGEERIRTAAVVSGSGT